ncbi:MAG TPA: CHRD domain-containing protein [Allosphingosinicella sp.]|nr:CHRD domain-containing protein [Allosphingosinicella sp.]
MSVSVKPRHVLLAAAGVLALAGCETVKEEVDEVVGNNFRADLTGGNVFPGPGDPDGSGKAAIAINDSTNSVCTDLEVRDIGAVAGAHIHRGGPGTSGPPVITLDAPDDNDSDDCDTVDDALVDEIRNNPGGFYVNVHTAEYPNGAIRGQIVNVEKDGV